MSESGAEVGGVVAVCPGGEAVAAFQEGGGDGLQIPLLVINTQTCFIFCFDRSSSRAHI